MFSRLLNNLLGTRSDVTVDAVRSRIRANQLGDALALVARLHPKTPKRELIASCLAAEIAFRQHRDDEAEQGFRRVLAKDPGFAEAHHGLSLLLVERGRLQDGLEHALFAKNLQPHEQRFIANLGYCYVMMEAYPGAEGLLNQAVKIDPEDKQSWNNLGVVLRTKGEMAQAKGCFMRALELDPDFRSARINLDRLDAELAAVGVGTEVVRYQVADPEQEQLVGLRPGAATWERVEGLWKSGDRDAALKMGESLGFAEDSGVDDTIHLAGLYRRAGDYAAAIDVAEVRLREAPDDPVLMAELGESYLMAENPKAAIAPLRRALAEGVETSKVHALLGAALHATESYADAVGAFRRALELDDTPGLRKQLGGALIMSCQYDEAIALYDDMLAQGQIQPDEMLGNYTSALAYVGRFDEAMANLNRILDTQAYDPAIRMMRAVIHLLHGRYDQGWDDYLWRHVSYSKNFRMLPFTKWRGESLQGKSIVVLAEQGLGDQVMFASCLPDLYALGPKRLVVEAIDRVAPTLARSFPQCEVIATRQKKDMQWAADLGDIDYFVPLADLPAVFRRSESDFPGSAYLEPDPLRRAYWGERLAGLGPGRKVGLSWKGGVEITRTTLRSMGPRDLQPLSDIQGVHWINLQYGPVNGKIAEFADVGIQLTHWPDAIKDLDEFAALVANLDEVITVCNTTVHYAGALGCPALVLAPAIPEWRYGLNGRKMPWYPQVEIVRQSTPGQWHEPVQEALRWLQSRQLDDKNARTTGLG